MEQEKRRGVIQAEDIEVTTRQAEDTGVDRGIRASITF